MYTVKESRSEKELQSILELRYTVLRQPWNQSAESATDELEHESINAYIADVNGKVIACGRLQENKNKAGQIRFMAVDNNYQGKGLGKLIVEYLEKKAKEKQLELIELQARENAVKFYENSGYKIISESFLLWGIIQHYLMQKSIKN